MGEIVTLDLSEGYWRHATFAIPNGTWYDLQAWMRVRSSGMNEPAAEQTPDGRPARTHLLLMYLFKEGEDGVFLSQMRTQFQSTGPPDQPEVEASVQAQGENMYLAPDLFEDADSGSVSSTHTLNNTRLGPGTYHFLAIGNGTLGNRVEISLPQKSVLDLQWGHESALVVEPHDLDAEAGASVNNDFPFTPDVAYRHVVNGSYQVEVTGLGVLVVQPTTPWATGEATYRYRMPDIQTPWLHGTSPDRVIEPEWSHPSETAHRWGGLGPPGTYLVEYRELTCEGEDMAKCGGREFFIDIPTSIPLPDRSS